MTKQFQYKKQQFQIDAVNAVCDAFIGVNLHTTNYCAAFKEQITNNIRKIQNKHKLKPQIRLDGAYPVLDVQMETGTGKTFVFVNTIFELNKRYGLTHFVIVVPSVAIKEGVKGTFNTTQNYFFDEYGSRINVFEYKTIANKNKGSMNSALFNFVQSDGLSVLITTAQALDKDGTKAASINVIYKKLEQSLFDKYRTAADAIASKRPVFIIDEAHGNVTDDSKALDSINNNLHPYFMLRYSATFLAEQVKNLVYVLDSYEAFKQKLVKKIGVREYQLSTYVSGSIYLKSINIKKNNPEAIVEVVSKSGELIEVTLRNLESVDSKKSCELFNKTKNPIYSNYYVKNIDAINNSVAFHNELDIQLQNSSLGKLFEDSMIRDTIKMHFKKESQLFIKNIKCLSLFFIDSVVDYRDYSMANERGYLQEKFEQIYSEELSNILINPNISPEYKNYLQKFNVTESHGGYFANDKKLNDALNGNNENTRAAQEEIYNLIMRDKASILQMDNKLRFIFAHSAIREGWDNPNVFQICQLRNIKNDTSKIQSIGRGLRLCVNSRLERMDSEVLGGDVFDINNLSVFIFSDNKFVENLQTELRSRISNFKASIPKFDSDIIQTTFGVSPVKATKIFANCFDDNENLLPIESLEQLFRANNLDFNQILPILTESVNNQVEHLDDDDFDINVKPRKYTVNLAKYQEFAKLWDILHRNVYFSVNYSENYIDEIVDTINDKLQINPVYINKTASEIVLANDNFNVTTSQLNADGVEQVVFKKSLNVFIDELCNKVKIPRKAIVQILQNINSHKFASIKNNPDLAIEKISQIINEVLYKNIIDNVNYHLQDGNDKRASWIDITSKEFEAKHYIELDNLPDYVNNCLYNEVSPYDSLNPEKYITEQSLQNSKITVFAKLPKKIMIPSPVESNGVNPDFAFVIKRPNKDDIYFVAEAKPTINDDGLRGQEKRKLSILKKYFATVGTHVEYDVVTSMNDVLTKLNDLLTKYN